jgi:hypothetical protein
VVRRWKKYICVEILSCRKVPIKLLGSLKKEYNFLRDVTLHCGCIHSSPRSEMDGALYVTDAYGGSVHRSVDLEYDLMSNNLNHSFLGS